MTRKTQSFVFILFILLTFFSLSSNVLGLEKRTCPGKWTNQEIYIPIYSALFAYGSDTRHLQMSANIVIGNTDDKNSITVSKFTYYDSNGKLLKHYINKPITLGPMASTYFLIKQQDTSGGWGANFILEWSSKVPVKEPFSKALFMGSIGNQSFSFDSQGKVISGH